MAGEDTTSVRVTKEWRGPQISASLPSVTVTLLRDGVSYRSMMLSDGNWARQFVNLPKSAPDGHAYVYTVGELGIPGFSQVSITGTMDSGFTILNETRNLNVFFVDRDGTTLKHERVPYGGSATPPPDPQWPNISFIGWRNDYTMVTRDTFVVAQYEHSPVDGSDDTFDTMLPQVGDSLNAGDSIE